MRLIDRYNSEIKTKLLTQLSIGNINAVPKLVKIIVNIGTGSKRQNSKFNDIATEDLGLITGQKPSLRHSRKAVAGFKLRKGEVIGLSVTLRGKRMYDFMEKLINVVIPRIRDFRGLSTNGFDKQGNYSFGIREHTVFPEINQEKIVEFYGLGITIVTSAQTDNNAEALLRSLGLPIKTSPVVSE